MDKLDELIEVSKRFTLAQGLCHHKWGHGPTATILKCIHCEKLVNGAHVKGGFQVFNKADDNPVYGIESIKAATQSWPCGTCWGNGCYANTDDFHCTSCQPDDTRCNFFKPCPLCTDGKRDMWNGFIEWHVKQGLVRIQHLKPDFNFIFAIQREASAEILTNPLLLMQAFLAYLGKADA